jgi:hypothetical protein
MLAKIRAAWKRYADKRQQELIDKAILEAEERRATRPDDFQHLDQAGGSPPGLPPGTGVGGGGG